MHPNEEAPQGYWEVDDPPDPTVAQTADEFVAELSELLRLSQLPLREIEHRAMAYGGFLPAGTVSNVLRGNTLPSEELLLPLLWAVGCDDETVELWVWARGNLAAANAQFDPSEVSWVPDDRKRYSEGALAHAVQERRGQSGWYGLHRHSIPADGEPKHASKRLRSKGFLPAIGGGTDRSSRAMIGLVIAGVIALAAGLAAALSDGDEVASPPDRTAGGQVCCLNSRAPASQTPAPQASTLATATPSPNASTKSAVSPTPRLTATPTQTQTQPPQPPKLTGSGSTTCVHQGGNWFVDVAVTATLTGAPSGTDPHGLAGHGASTNSFTLTGSGSTSFSGHTSFDVGPDTAPVQGTIQWSVTVSVPSGGTVDASGSASFSCTPEGA